MLLSIMHTLRPAFLTGFALLAAACGTGLRPAPTPPAAVPPPGAASRIVATNGSAVTSVELASIAAKANLVFFGEQHGDPETHFAEFALLEGIGRLRQNVVVSMEMFERDVQGVLDDYLAGRITEAEFLEKARPWPRYATDYRPLVLLAKARGWPVIAANAPRPIATAVSRVGLALLDTLNASSRAHVARDIECPRDAYYDRFAEQMQSHGGPGTAPDTATMRAMTNRFYEAQCIKDETMAESITAAMERAGKDAIVVHFNGAFHSDWSLGAVSRALRRVRTPHVVISSVAVPNVAVDPGGDVLGRGHFVLLTRRTGR
jgi:uncharacterized iron-regulated protein